MDPNYDWMFGDTPCLKSGQSPPCPNGGSDIRYLLRFVVKKYNWLDMGLSAAYREEDTVHVRVKALKYVDRETIATATPDDTDVIVEFRTSDGALFTISAAFSEGFFVAVTELSSSETATVAIIMFTKTSTGETADGD